MRIAEAYHLASLMEAETIASSSRDEERDGATKETSSELMEIAEPSQNGSTEGDRDADVGDGASDVTPPAAGARSCPSFSRHWPLTSTLEALSSPAT
jgi:hypothetical protein